MPLIIISGFPASGKSTRAQELQKYFTDLGKTVHVISENEAIPKAGFYKNDYFLDSQKEKQVRSDLKSEVIRLLSTDNVIIFDAGNYIKGFRYEIYCATKCIRTTQLTLFCGIQNEKAWEFNQKRRGIEPTNLHNNIDQCNFINNSDIPYTDEVFQQLCMRFEEPHGNCRWDKPLFVLFPEDKLDELYLKNIYNALFETAPLPPNQSTQNAPVSASNYLFEMDQLTQKIVAEVLSARKIGILSPVPVVGSQVKVDIPHNINAIQLNRLRRQFLNYSKLHFSAESTLDKIPQLFVQFLNANCIIDR